MTYEKAHEVLASYVAAPGKTLPRLDHTGEGRWAVGDENTDQPRIGGLAFESAVQEWQRRVIAGGLANNTEAR